MPSSISKTVVPNKSCGAQIDKYSYIFPSKKIFTKLGGDYKGGNEKGWNKAENLLSFEQAKKHVSSGGNIGLTHGEIGEYWYATFDIEQAGILPVDAKAIIDPHTVIKFETPHGGKNRIVRMDEETYEYIDSLQEIEKLDIEILTQDNGVTLPPSDISHRECSQNKPCNGIGRDAYTLQEVNVGTPSLNIEDAKQLASILDVDPQEETEPSVTYENEDIDAPGALEVTNSVNILKEFQENVPSVSDSFQDRKQRMLYSDWDAQEHFIKLWNGNFEDVSGSNPQGKAECRLANYIGFWFGRNQKIIQYFMENLDFETHYEKYPSHRKNLLDYATSVDWIFCEGVSFETKFIVAFNLMGNDYHTVNSLADEIDTVSKRQIRYTLPILQTEGVISKEKDGKEYVYDATELTEGYLLGLDGVLDKHDTPEEEDPVETQAEVMEI